MNKTNKVKSVREMIRHTKGCLYARVAGIDYNLKIVKVITQHGAPIIVTTRPDYLSFEQIDGWIDGRNGQTLTV